MVRHRHADKKAVQHCSVQLGQPCRCSEHTLHNWLATFHLKAMQRCCAHALKHDCKVIGELDKIKRLWKKHFLRYLPKSWVHYWYRRMLLWLKSAEKETHVWHECDCTQNSQTENDVHLQCSTSDTPDATYPVSSKFHCLSQNSQYLHAAHGTHT